MSGVTTVPAPTVNSGKSGEIGFAHGYILELLHWVYTRIDKGKQNPPNLTIQKILDCISEKNGKITVEEISEAVYMNKFYICHVFKDKTGRNLSDYISDKIYESAVKMLKTNTYTIKEIAFECGFSAPSSFTRFFKNKSGISPAQFRKQQVV